MAVSTPIGQFRVHRRQALQVPKTMFFNRFRSSSLRGAPALTHQGKIRPVQSIRRLKIFRI